MEFIRQYEILLKKAKTDFSAAKILYKGVEGGDLSLDLEVVMFHLQQSVEKLLKSLLSKKSVHVTKTHSLKELFKKLDENKIEINTTIDSFIALEGYAVEGRYAVIHDDIDNLEKIILSISELLEFVERTINE
jgi:HEPN domain-containing protein